ncbi:MAG: cadherin repeat domain-containing protein [Chloroflexi bacterium]|nr:cadherin repeat domain-containing protein [Chloroflexota bacterium]
MSRRRRGVALLASLLMMAAAAASAWASIGREQGLKLMLTVPRTCDIEGDERDEELTLNVEWQVVGGEPPYEVFVDDSRVGQAQGVTQLLCGVWVGRDVDSGLFAVQAHVRDATGATAGALSYVNAVRSIRADSYGGPGDTELQAGLTYRVHGILITVPEAFDLHLGDYTSADCRDLDAPCADRFQLFTGSWNFRGSSIWIRRWPAEEFSREVSAYGALDADAVSAAFDQLVASINQPASDLAPPSVSGGGASDLRLRMIAPAICEETGPTWRPSQSVVAWEVSGGVAPYRIVIDGHMFGAAFGDLHVQCGRLTRGVSDSGLHSVHGIVIDANGNVASGVVHTYGIKNVVAADLHGGETYRVSGQLLTIPAGVVADAGGYEHSSCDPPEGDDRNDPYYCEDAFSLWMDSDGVSASVWFGVESGRAYGEEPRATTPAVGSDHPSHTQLGALVASVGQPPTLRDDLADQLAPLRITADVDPISCQFGGYNIQTARERNEHWSSWHDGEYTTANPIGGPALNLNWSVTGGYWTPLTITVNGRDPSAHRLVLNCPQQGGTHEIRLTASDRSDPPQSDELTLEYESLARSIEEQLPFSAAALLSSHCRPGEAVLIGWNAYSEQGPVAITIDGVDGQLDPGGVATVRCQQSIGTQTVMLRATDQAQPPHQSTATVHINVTDSPPQRVGMRVIAKASPSATCTTGERVQIVWRATGGVPPYRVRAPGDEPARVDGSIIELDCPPGSDNPHVTIEITDSNVMPTVLRQHVSLDVTSDAPDEP